MRFVFCSLDTIAPLIEDMLFQSAYKLDNQLFVVWKIKFSALPGSKYKTIESNQLLSPDANGLPINHCVIVEKSHINKVFFDRNVDIIYCDKPAFLDGAVKINALGGGSNSQNFGCVWDFETTWCTRKDRFMDQLNILGKKVKDLSERPKINQTIEPVYKLAEELHENLTQAAKDYIEDQKTSRSTFIATCTDLINTARPILEKHRTWSQVFANLALAIAGLGIGYAVASLINKAVTGNFLFFKTDSAQKLDKLQHCIDHLSSNFKTF